MTEAYINLKTPEKSRTDKKHYEAIKLQNGIKALLISVDKVDDENEDEEDRLAACSVCFNVGSFYDTLRVQGLAHLLEHIVFMGSKKYPIENAIESYLTKHCGSTNASTGCERTTLYFDVDVDHLEKALDMFTNGLICPLIKVDSIVKELQAIESEYSLALVDDDSRVEQFISYLSLDSHPAHLFGWGNLKSLQNSITGDELCKALTDFHGKYYSSDIMTIAIQAYLPLEKLKENIIKYFSWIPNLNAKNKLLEIDHNSLKPNVLKHLYHVKCVGNTRRLLLYWPIKQVNKIMKPDEYVTYLLRHEGEGGLLWHLKSKGWIVRLSGMNKYEDDVCDNSSYRLYHMNITLTDLGMKNINNIISYVYGYINKIKSIEIPQSIFEQLKLLRNYKFDINEDIEPTDYTSLLCESMQQYDSEYYISGPYKLFDYDMKEIQSILSSLNPDNSFAILLTRNIGTVTDIEPWFSIEYSKKELEPIIEIDEEFSLPKENKYMACNSDILPFTGNERKYPILLINDNSRKLWYKRDKYFKLPGGCVKLLIKPYDEITLENSIMLDIYATLLHKLFCEDIQAAHDASISTSIRSSSALNGLDISIIGYNHKFPLILYKILENMKNMKKEDKEFEFCKKEVWIGYKNNLSDNEVVYRDIKLSLTLIKYFRIDEKVNNVLGINYNDFKNFITKYLENMNILCLIHGNVSEEQAIEITDNITRILKPIELNKMIEEEEILYELPNGNQNIRLNSFNCKECNSLICNYYQYGLLNDVDLAKLDFFVKIMEEPLFNVLRTEEQLGYDVGVNATYANGISGFEVYVVSKSDPNGDLLIKGRIDHFLKKFRNILENLEEEEFEDHRESYINEKKLPYINIEEEISFYWSEIINEEYLFDRHEKDIEAISDVTLKDIFELFSSFDNKCLTIEIHGQKDGINNDEGNDSIKQLSLFGPIKNDDNEHKNNFILNIHQFKNQLLFYRKNVKIPI